MRFKRVISDEVPEPGPGMWSNCKKVGEMVFISGLVAIDKNGEVVSPSDAYSQAYCIFSYINKYMKLAGGEMNDIAKMTIFLTDIRDRPKVLEARQKFFSDDFPCSTLVAVNALIDPRMLVEIEATAIVGASK